MEGKSDVTTSTRFAQLRALAGLDFHVLLTLLSRAWAALAGALTILLLPHWLSANEQGYYFTFASILALQIFFELGLNQVVMQFVSHEVAHLTATTNGQLLGDERILGRLSSLAQLIKRWYRFAALLFAAIGGLAGIVFFAEKGHDPISLWLGIWLVLISATACNLWFSPGLAVMEGCGKVGQIARLRLVQSLLGHGLLWLVLLSGGGLWATIAVPAVSVFCTGYWLKTQGNTLDWLAGRVVDIKSKLSWRNEIFPVQWRIALSWASGYLIFNLFTPVIFARQGAAEAGRLGLALTLFSGVSTIGMSWVNAKAPSFTSHISLKQKHELNKLFVAVFVRSTLFIFFVSAGLVTAAIFLDHLGLTFMTRISSPNVIAVIGGVTLVNSMVFSMAIYMRAHREEPMLSQSIAVGLLTAIAVYFGSSFGVLNMMLWYLAVCSFVSLPWTIVLFLRYWNRRLSGCD